METLNQRQKNSAGIAASTAVGNLDLLKRELNSVLDAGMTINEAQEIMVHLDAYTGFPRSLQGLRTLTGISAERQDLGIRDNSGREASPIRHTADKVVFDPGCRNNWYSHSAGQILLVTDGRGIYQEREKTARRLSKGFEPGSDENYKQAHQYLYD